MTKLGEFLIENFTIKELYTIPVNELQIIIRCVKDHLKEVDND